MDDTCLANYTTIDFLKLWKKFEKREKGSNLPLFYYKENIYCERKSFMRIL